MSNDLIIPRISTDLELPALVYHYTSMEALLSILEKRALWATNVRYLNDVSEYQVFMRAAVEQVDAFVSTHHDVKVDPFYEHDYNQKDSPEPFTMLPFTTSFTEAGDSLTHWRSYCPNGNGVSIGFSTVALQATTLGNSTTEIFESPQFNRVEYFDPNEPRKVREALEKAYAAAQVDAKLQEMLYEDLQLEMHDLFFNKVKELAPFYKNILFKDERECRLVVSDIEYRQKLIKYRTSASTLVPYVSVDLPENDRLSSGERPPWATIKEIIVGPTPNVDLSMDALRTLCQVKEVMLVDIVNSKVPYRDW